MRIVVAVVGVSVLIAVALIFAMWRIGGDEDFERADLSGLESLPTTPDGAPLPPHLLDIIFPPPVAIRSVPEVGAYVDWPPLCSQSMAASAMWLERAVPTSLRFPEIPRLVSMFGTIATSPPSADLVLQQGADVESLVPTDGRRDDVEIGSFDVRIATTDNAVEAWFETGERDADGDAIVALVSRTDGDRDAVIDFIESLTFDCGA